MTFDRGGSYFGTNDSFAGGVNKNHSNLLDKDAKALLYVFAPNDKTIGDVGLRPFAYHFDENFLAGAGELTNQSLRGVDWSPALVEDMMLRSNFSNNMTVSSQPSIHLKTSYLSSSWRFILILTEKSRDLIGVNTVMSTGGNQQVRRIYTGFFEDEPFNPTTLTDYRRTPNPHAVMVFTHKTVMGMTTSHGRYGPETMISTRTSEEFVLPAYTKSLATGSGFNQRDELHLMTPANCVNSIATSEDGYSFATPGVHSNITNDQGVIPVSDLFEQPSQNVSYVLKGLLKTQDDFNARKRMAHRRTDRFFEDSFMGEGFHRQSLANNLEIPRSPKMSVFDLDVDSRISVQDLDQMVSGDMDVVPMNMESPLFYDTADQSESSVTNKYSFLIASVMSPILNSAGLNELQFAYQKAWVRGEVRDNFKVEGAAANWVVPQEDLNQMVRAVMTELASGIFDTIFQSMGDFHVVVNAYVTGITTVRLSLVGQGMKCHTDFELPSYLGGIISPLIGTDINNAENTQSIEGLYGVATGSSEPSYFNQDDKDFMNYANNLSFDDPNPANPWAEELN